MQQASNIKVAVILLTCNRSELTKKVIEQNLFNTFHPFDLIWVDNGSDEENLKVVENSVKATRGDNWLGIPLTSNIGISGGQNVGIDAAMTDEYNSYDAVVLMSNDILMPSGWLKEMVEHHKAIPETGTIGIHCVEGKNDIELIGGKEVHPTATAFGNVYIPRTTIEKVGYQNTDFDPYGMQDADFGFRVRMAGLINYYVSGIKSEHIGHDVERKDEYRLMKDRSLALAGEKYARWTSQYEKTGKYYLPYEQENYIINQQQYAEV